MIRDEFTNNKDSDLTPKEILKIREVGEKAFYSSQIMNLRSVIKTLNFTLSIIAVSVLVATILIVYVLVVRGGFGGDNELIIGSIVVGVLFIGVLIWYVIAMPISKKKMARYKAKLQEYNEAQAERNKIIYKKYIK